MDVNEVQNGSKLMKNGNKSQPGDEEETHGNEQRVQRSYKRTTLGEEFPSDKEPWKIKERKGSEKECREDGAEER